MWGKKSTPEPAAPAVEPSAASPGTTATRQLSTKDVKSGLDLALNLGQSPEKRSENGAYALFELPFYCKKVLWDDWLSTFQNQHVQTFMNSDTYKTASAQLIKSLDADGDGELTAKDLQKLYDTKLTPTLDKHEGTLDRYLPFLGQLAFGLGVGYASGFLARRFLRHRFLIATVSFIGYSTLQYGVQQNYLNRQQLEKDFQSTLVRLADTNGDGKLDRKDVEAIVDNRMRYLSAKLGAGGLAPGATGYTSLLLGFAKGMRFL